MDCSKWLTLPYICGGITTTIMYCVYMRDFYSTPYKARVTLTTKIVDFIMMTGLNLTMASAWGIGAYLISLPIDALITYVRIISSGDKVAIEQMNKNITKAVNEFQKISPERIKEGADKLRIESDISNKQMEQERENSRRRMEQDKLHIESRMRCYGKPY